MSSQYTAPPGTPPPSFRPMKKSYKAPVILLITGFLVALLPAAIGGILLASSISKINGSQHTLVVPATANIKLSPGSYVVYQNEPFNPQNSRYYHTLNPSDVTAIAPNNQEIEVSHVSTQQSTNVGADTFVGAAQFTASTPGVYKIHVSSTQSVPEGTHILVAPDVGSVLLSLLLPIVLMALGLGVGVILMFIGFILLLVKLLSKN